MDNNKKESMEDFTDRELFEMRKLKIKLFKRVFWGLVAITIAFAFVYSRTGNPYNEYLLLTSGTTTSGLITKAFEDVTFDDSGGTRFYSTYIFTFETEKGNTITARSNSNGRLPEKLSDLNDPFPTQIVYLKSNPEINKLKATLSNSIWEIVWRKIGLGIVLLIAFSSIGFLLIRNAVKEYSTEIKKMKDGYGRYGSY